MCSPRPATTATNHRNTMQETPTLAAADAAFSLHEETPLHQRPPAEVLRVLFEEHGTAAAPQKLPTAPHKPQPQRFQVGLSVRFYTAQDMQFLLEELHAALVKQSPKPSPEAPR